MSGRLDGTHAGLASLPARPGCDAVVQVKIGSDVVVHTVVDGAVSAGGSSPNVLLTLSAAEAADVEAGRQRPTDLFMQGRLKTEGDQRALLAWLALTDSPEWRALD